MSRLHVPDEMAESLERTREWEEDKLPHSFLGVVRRHPHLAMVALAGDTAPHIQKAHHIEPYPWTGNETERTLANAKYHYEAHHPRRRDA